MAHGLEMVPKQYYGQIKSALILISSDINTQHQSLKRRILETKRKGQNLNRLRKKKLRKVLKADNRRQSKHKGTRAEVDLKG